MQLPLLLAGPILRRVDPGLVAVQVVLSEAADVRLTVYEGRGGVRHHQPPVRDEQRPTGPQRAGPHPGEKTVRIGERLHLGLVSARLPPASGRVFQSDRLYWVPIVTITGASQARTDLAGLGLLGAHTVSGVECGPLGYADRMLPCFALPPTELVDLRLAYGSCRRPGYDDGDAPAWMDEYLNERFDDPRGRIRQLFLGGDQIYADDVDSLMMLRTAQLGVELIGTDAGRAPRARHGQPGPAQAADTRPDPTDPNAATRPRPRRRRPRRATSRPDRRSSRSVTGCA